MSRSGYSDDCANVCLWRSAVRRATTGYRGQHLLKRLLAALDAMETKRLIADQIKDEAGQVCALGALDPTAQSYEAEDLATHFGVARALAAEIVYENDEHFSYWSAPQETPEQRWTRMRAWVASQITPDEPETVGAVDPVGGNSRRLTTRVKTSIFYALNAGGH